MDYGIKKYVRVRVDFAADGKLLPEGLFWEDGRYFPIDKVTDVRPAASMKAGGAGIRYTCRISGKTRYLFLEENRWFIETDAH